MWPLAEVIAEVICCHFKDCFWKIVTLYAALQKKQNIEAGLKGAHMINKAVLLKWNVANGGGRGLREIVGGGGV